MVKIKHIFKTKEYIYVEAIYKNNRYGQSYNISNPNSKLYVENEEMAKEKLTNFVLEFISKD